MKGISIHFVFMPNLFLGFLHPKWCLFFLAWWTLHGCCYFLPDRGWLLLLLGGPWTVAIIS